MKIVCLHGRGRRTSGKETKKADHGESNIKTSNGYVVFEYF
jgi:hypothetical protein